MSARWIILTTQHVKDQLEEAIKLHQGGDPNGAARMYAAILRDEPDNVAALANLSHILTAARHYDAAVRTSKKAYELSPEGIGTSLNYARAMWARGRCDEDLEVVLPIVDALCERDSSIFGSQHTKALLLHFLDRREDAIEYYDNAIAICPNSLESQPARNDRAIALMGMGRWAEGLEEFECRFDSPNVVRHAISRVTPEWKGEDLTGKSIAIWHEQGIGDSIQFARFARHLYDLGAERVVFVVPPALVRLFQRRLVGVEIWNAASRSVPDVDFCTPTMSMFRWIGEAFHAHPNYSGFSKDEIYKSLIVGEPYLSQNVEDHGLIPILDMPRDKMRIGIVWAGLSSPDADRRRSSTLETLLRLAEIPGVALCSLQFGDRAKDLDVSGAETFIYDAMEGVRDYEDTALLLPQLDLVVSIDSSVVHLAGAMGVPTFVLCDRNTCWRWPRDSMRSLWYDSVTVFRKQHHGTGPDAFGATLDRVCSIVRAMLAGWHHAGRRAATVAMTLPQTVKVPATLPEDAIGAYVTTEPASLVDTHAEWRALNQGSEPAEILDGIKDAMRNPLAVVDLGFDSTPRSYRDAAIAARTAVSVARQVTQKHGDKENKEQ